MLNDIRTIISRSPLALIQDALGVAAIGVIMTVALHMASPI